MVLLKSLYTYAATPNLSIHYLEELNVRTQMSEAVGFNIK